MTGFREWLAVSPLASALRVFIAIILSMAVADWVANGSINFGAYQTWIIAGLASAVPVVARWLNPQDLAFGRGSKVDDPFDVWGEE